MAAISTIEYGSNPETQADLRLRDLSADSQGSIVYAMAPTIVLHGANDTNVPVIEAEQVVLEQPAKSCRNVPVASMYSFPTRVTRLQQDGEPHHGDRVDRSLVRRVPSVAGYLVSAGSRAAGDFRLTKVKAPEVLTTPGASFPW